MQLFYNPLLNAQAETFTFGREESKHIVKVLRKKQGDKIFVTNGLGYLFTTEVVLPSDSKCTVKILSAERQAQRSYKLHLAVAPTKMNDRYEWFLEKATEIGVDEITPIICDHSEKKTVKSDRFEKIVQAAMKQSLHCYLPKINDPMPFKTFVQSEFEGIKCIAHCEETTRKSLQSILRPATTVTILIGPEGDFSEKEIALALHNEFQPVMLGNTRLRTETAAIVACHSAAIINE